MRSALLRRAALVAALPVLLGAVTAGTALARTATATRVDPAAPRAGAPPETTALTLINGDRLLTSSDGNGRRSSVVLKAPGQSSGLSTSLVTLRSGSQELVVPWAALPYLGRGLDPRLFEVGALRRAERDGRLPVTIRYAGHRPALPGVTVTSQGPGLEQGYLTASSARAFAAALARQMMSDHSRGSYGTDGLFAGGLSISLPGAAQAPARPHFKTHTLTVKATNLAGQPDTGDLVEVFNVNDKAVFGVGGEDWLNGFDRGTAKYSAPSGTYWAIALFFKNTKRSANAWIDVLPQFTIAGDTTIRLRARAATSRVTMATPRSAVLDDRGVTVTRSAHGQATATGVDVTGAGSVWINPTSARPSDGTLQAFTTAMLTSPPGHGIPYAYVLNFVGSHGIIPRQRFVARPGSLATISERFYQDVPSTGAWVMFGGTATQLEDTLPGSVVRPFRLPGRQIQYVSARPAMFWQNVYWESADSLAGGQTDTFRLLHPGQHLDEDWGRYPLHPVPNVGGPRFQLSVPSAVRFGNKLIVDTAPFSDNQRGHIGTGYSNGLLPGSQSKITGSYAIYQNGVKIAGGDAVRAAAGGPRVIAEANLSSRPSAIRFVLNAARTGRNYRLSTVSRDVWTWRSQREPHSVVPVPWGCAFTASGVSRQCAVQPMLTLSYQVSGMSLAGTTRAGRQVLELTVGHLQLAVQSRITRAGVRVSVNGGRTWQRASVRPAGAGRFRVQFTEPGSHDVTLQVTARDATGATITETITGAYRTSA